MSITPDFIRILFVECASRQTRVSIFFAFSRIVSGIYIVHWVGCYPTGCPVYCGIPQCWCPVLVSFRERVFSIAPTTTAQRYNIFSRYANKILILIGNVLMFELKLCCFPRCLCAFSSKSKDLFVYVKKKL